ncbi:MAG: hypothetical protein ACRDPY_17620 [Streptosporangiaceae bacterium]
MRAVAGSTAGRGAGRGRWVWALSGVATAALLAVPITHAITTAGDPPADVAYAQPAPVSTRTITVKQPVTSVTILSYGSPVQVTTGSVSHVEVTESFGFVNGPEPWPVSVTQTVSGGHLLLSDPQCAPAGPGCAVTFALTVPPGVAVTAVSDGGPISVSGVAGANLDSGGGTVSAAKIDGPLTVRTEGGPLLVDGLTGALNVDTGNAPFIAQGVDASIATVSTDGGNARIAFTAPPDSVTVATDGGTAFLTIPGGPYALTADSDGGPETVRIPTNPAASRSLTVSTAGSPLWIAPASKG